MVSFFNILFEDSDKLDDEMNKWLQMVGCSEGTEIVNWVGSINCVHYEVVLESQTLWANELHLGPRLVAVNECVFVQNEI